MTTKIKAQDDTTYNRLMTDLANAYRKANPFFVVTTKKGRLKIKYDKKSKTLIRAAKHTLADYLRTNYPDINYPF